MNCNANCKQGRECTCTPEQESEPTHPFWRDPEFPLVSAVGLVLALIAFVVVGAYFGFGG